MRIKYSDIPLFLSALLPSLASASGFDCAHINTDGYKYDLSPLKGVHEVYHVEETEQYVTNTSYVLNICNILKGSAIRGDAKCGTSKNICGFVHRNAKDGHGSSTFGFPIVGLDHLGHGSKDPEVTRLKKIDADREGLLVKLAGGEYREDFDKGKTKNAGATIEFKCDPDRSGLEGLHTTLEDPDPAKRLRRRAGNSTQGDDANAGDRSLQFKSFGQDGDSYVLKLDWRTRYACDDYQRTKGSGGSGHWGFFTWLIIIAFLLTAAYLIFGSWLNYSRYGARGWDLLPHSDIIRDIPYIFQDWLRHVINTLQGTGTGSRGGYSAV
ncbi:hypothetical protein NUU61_006057 [Penicillium alfredii]|uniref:Autophagy-related protein 27 n=1 Tax=Penicillium alfredii TaxID=1506179 RepID=A0A9W9K3W4_9EURO|nr:uncharacterized protein NUU61_006057 [Penicillium alfredii]KAJ5091187.1 hypothetical protein NUU61_006057 [Penicillium alfredii]